MLNSKRMSIEQDNKIAMIRDAVIIDTRRQTSLCDMNCHKEVTCRSQCHNYSFFGKVEHCITSHFYIILLPAYGLPSSAVNLFDEVGIPNQEPPTIYVQIRSLLFDALILDLDCVIADGWRINLLFLLRLRGDYNRNRQITRLIGQFQQGIEYHPLARYATFVLLYPAPRLTCRDRHQQGVQNIVYNIAGPVGPQG
jgi:hypothetical protein